MASKTTIKMVFQFRRATAAEWDAHKPVVPAPGEPCFVTDENILKIGDGETPFHELEPINGVKVEIAADGKSVVMKDNIFKLAGFDEAAVGAQPRKAADGTLEWIVPSTETLDGLQKAVAGLQSDVKTLQDIIGVSAGKDPLINRVEKVEDAISVLNGDVAVEGSVQKIVADAIDAWANNVTDNGKVDSIKELVDYVAEHGTEVVKMTSDIVTLQGLVGGKSVEEQIASAIADAGYMTETKVMAMFDKVKYEVSSKPVGTLVDYREKEIRIMCPADTVWTKQQSGANADANKHYIGVKMYAPAGAVSFKEDTAEVIVDETMHSFEGNDFAGIDAFGRKYSIIWLPAAAYDEASATWTYYGANSTAEHFVGWYYSVEWYDANGVKIGSDKIRINLSNEECHNEIKPFYMEGMANKIESIKVGNTIMNIIDKQVEIPVGAGLKGSDEVEIAEDGAIRIKAMSWDKLIGGESEIVMDGGGAV